MRHVAGCTHRLGGNWKVKKDVRRRISVGSCGMRCWFTSHLYKAAGTRWVRRVAWSRAPGTHQAQTSSRQEWPSPLQSSKPSDLEMWNLVKTQNYPKWTFHLGGWVAPWVVSKTCFRCFLHNSTCSALSRGSLDSKNMEREWKAFSK